MQAQDFRFTIVTTMKNEGPYILDWIAHHLAIGVTHFVVMTNDCTDGTDDILKQLEKTGIVTHARNNPPYPKGVQKTAYARMRRFDAVQNADWLLPLDVDEYLRLDSHEDLPQLTATLPEDIDAVSFVWQIFGHNGVANLVNEPITTQFTRAAHRHQMQPYHTRGLKTLFRRDRFEKIGTHRPSKPLCPNPLGWLDGDGAIMPEHALGKYWLVFNDGRGFGERLGRVHHYALRSKTAFLLKWARGFVNRKAGIRTEAFDYWQCFDWNLVEENRLSLPNPAVTSIHAQITSSKLAELHDDAFTRHLCEAEQQKLALPELWEWILAQPPRKDYLGFDHPDLYIPELPWEYADYMLNRPKQYRI